MNSLIPLKWLSPSVIVMISGLCVHFELISYLYPLRGSLEPVYTVSKLVIDCLPNYLLSIYLFNNNVFRGYTHLVYRLFYHVVVHKRHEIIYIHTKHQINKTKFLYSNCLILLFCQNLYAFYFVDTAVWRVGVQLHMFLKGYPLEAKTAPKN